MLIIHIQFTFVNTVANRDPARHSWAWGLSPTRLTLTLTLTLTLDPSST